MKPLIKEINGINPQLGKDCYISENATIDPDEGMSQDFTNPVTYTVTAEDGITIQDWVVWGRPQKTKETN